MKVNENPNCSLTDYLSISTLFGEVLEVKKQSATQTHTSLSLSLSSAVCLSPALPQPFSDQISYTLLPRICAKGISSWAIIATN